MSTKRYGPYTVELSNEEKVLFPDAGLTKQDLLDYYTRIADRLLPHLAERALVVQRFPDGIDAEGFYQKQILATAPEWVSSVRVDVAGTGGKQTLAVCDNQATLAYLVDQACITLHPWLSRTRRIHHPDRLVVDLDPPQGDFEAARRTALHVRELLDELGLVGFAKLTGSEGIHVEVPLDRSADFDAVRGFTRDAMSLLSTRYPEMLTTEVRKDARHGRLYLDVSRNAYAQTAVAPWSVRPLPGAPIAAPVAWTELERSGIGPRDYTVESVFRRIERRDDPWAGMRRHARSLDGPRERLRDRLARET